MYLGKNDRFTLKQAEMRFSTTFISPWRILSNNALIRTIDDDWQEQLNGLFEL